MTKLSIKARITLWYTLIVLIISVVALFIMTTVSREMLMNDSAKKLVSAVDRTMPMVNAPKNDIMDFPKEDFGKLPGFMFFNDGVHTAVCDENGSIIGGALPFEFADEIEFKNEEVQEKVFDGNRYLTYAKRTQEKESIYWIIGVISIANESMLIDSVIKTNIILIAVLILVAAIGGYLILKQAFKPVNRISGTAKLISESNDLSQRIALSGGNDEIHSLADTFDEMLAKIEKTLENEKQFTADASHELRTPVAVISSECEYVLDCATALDEAKESVNVIKQQSDKMARLISELLMISRMDRNTNILKIENVDLSELLSFVCDEQEETHRENIVIKRNIAENIFAKTDSMLMARVFANLISNAYSYGKENGTIEVTLTENQNEVVFEIYDDGIGIAEEDLPKIWERFYQVDSSRTNDNGSMGLGLSMVKIIADKLGIRMDVESKLGEGTKFTGALFKNIG